MPGLIDTFEVLLNYGAAKRRTSKIKTRFDLVTLQDQELARFRKNVLRKSPFYAAFADKPLSEFPIISKSEMLENFDRINTKGIHLEEALDVGLKAERDRDFSPTLSGVTVGLSSGTSGQRGVFLVSRSERLKWAGTMLALAMPHSIFRPTRIAFFLRANSNLYTTLNQGRHLKLDFYDITDGKSLEFDSDNVVLRPKFVEQLYATQPDVIVAPASVLLHISRRLVAARFLNLKRLFSVGEVLEPEVKTEIEANFEKCSYYHLRVDQIYQCTEGLLGISDRQGRLMLNEAFVHIEKDWIDRKSGRFSPIITDFSRTTQPIVRYRLDDVLVEDQDAEGPFTILKAIEGRADSTLLFPRADGSLQPIFADAVRQAMVASTLSFSEYRIVQIAPGFIELFYEGFGTSAQSAGFQEVIKGLAERFGCLTPATAVTPADRRPFDQKLRRIECRFSSDQKAVA